MAGSNQSPESSKSKDPWEAWKKMDEPKPPAHFFYNVDDERISRLMVEVWRRLPDYDRQVLTELVTDVNDDCQADEHVLGSAGPIHLGEPMHGNAGDLAMDLSSVVSLRGARDVTSDEACMGVIAHEFAHVVLRHNQLSIVANFLARFGDAYYDHADFGSLRDWHEDHADLQIWVWGFQEELSALLDEFLESRRPRWHVEFESGPGEQTCAANGPTAQGSDSDCDDTDCET